MALSIEEKLHFTQKGYIVRHLDLSPQIARQAVDLAWRHVDPRFKREDPKTWTGEVSDDCRVASIAKRRGRLKFRESVRDTPWLRDIVFGNPEVRAIVRDLLGEKAVPRKHIRGLYPIFPSPSSSHTLDGGMDGHPFQICCIIYLSDVEPSGGGFTVWEGSHKIMQFAFDGKASWKLNGKHDPCKHEAMATCRRVELPGPIGTAIFWHHRLLHTPSTNRRDTVRHALVADFIQSDWEAKAGQPHEDDMWADWPIAAIARPSLAFADSGAPGV